MLHSPLLMNLFKSGIPASNFFCYYYSNLGSFFIFSLQDDMSVEEEEEDDNGVSIMWVFL